MMVNIINIDQKYYEKNHSLSPSRKMAHDRNSSPRIIVERLLFHSPDPNQRRSRRRYLSRDRSSSHSRYRSPIPYYLSRNERSTKNDLHSSTSIHNYYSQRRNSSTSRRDHSKNRYRSPLRRKIVLLQPTEEPKSKHIKSLSRKKFQK